jgi:hypothetical protein
MELKMHKAFLKKNTTLKYDQHCGRLSSDK